MKADILVLGFQEIVELNAKQVLIGGNSEAISSWNELILKVLNKDIEKESKRYSLVIAENLVGLHTALYARKSIASKLKEITTSKIKLGFAG